MPTQANYVMLELLQSVTAADFTRELFVGYGIFVTDLSSKITGGGQYLRVAVRNTEDNLKLTSAIADLLGGGGRS